MRVFVLSKVEPRVSNTRVDGVIFGGIVEVSIVTQVKETGVANEKGRFEKSEVASDGHVVGRDPLGVVE